ncbi:hypothetical protein C8Q74DRAFT_286896 [Fomes fomentarius]|nr:hypothetical protein C8Q74DRAFT_286896 [Fomes fomentarius]
MPHTHSNDPDLDPDSLLHPSHHPFDDESLDVPHSPSHPGLPKKKHVCQICKRAFTTSGHLARHTRIHTGERNHKCPFPGCETRCSRQDNLQQHYRIHLSPGSRRNSGSATRAAMTRASASDRSKAAARRRKQPSAEPISPSPPPPPPSPPLEPPPLVPAYSAIPTIPSQIPEPPDTPPPLTPAYPTATLPPPTTAVYNPHNPHPSSSSRSPSLTPDAVYSPVEYAHPSLPPTQHSHYPHYAHQDDLNSYPPSSQNTSRASSSFGRPAGDSRWSYPTQSHPQGQQPYPHSDSDRFSPISPANGAPTHAHYSEPVSPADSISAHHRGQHMQMQQQQQDNTYFNHYSAARQSAGASPVSFSQTHSQPSQSQIASLSLPPPTSHRHSIAHISNPIRQHSPTATSTASASPVVSSPPTPGYPSGGYASHAHSMTTGAGGYAESPPGSLSPVSQTHPHTHAQPNAQPQVMQVYSSYESSSLASAGYTHPPPQPAQSPEIQSQMDVQQQQQQQQSQQQQQQQAPYDRTLPALTMHYDYAQSASYHPSHPSERYTNSSPRPVLAPLHDSHPRVGRADPGSRYPSGAGSGTGSYSNGSSPQPSPYAHTQTQGHTQTQPQQQQAMQSLASVSRPQPQPQHHAFPYPAHSHVSQAQSPHSAGESTSYTHGPASAYAPASVSVSVPSASASGYYYQPSHMARDPSPDSAEADVGAGTGAYLEVELHQPQPQRNLGGHASQTQSQSHQQQYMQTLAAGHGHVHGQGHGGHGHGQGQGYPGQHLVHPVWRADDYRGTRLVQ